MHAYLLQADKSELESELSTSRNSAEELASQLRMESDAYENRIRALNDRLTEMRALCDQQERQLEAQADDVSQKQARVPLSRPELLLLGLTWGDVVWAENVHALEGLASRKRVAPASSPAAPASRVRRSHFLRSTLAAAPGLLAHALVTKQ